MKPSIAKISLFPLKSLDGVEVSQATLLAGGALAHDREFALCNAAGKLINAKRTEKIQQVRSQSDLPARTITLRVEGTTQSDQFHLDEERGAIAAWFSDYFGYPVTLQQNLHMGFPDDTVASGPTIVSTATLETVGAWFGLSLAETRLRFRTNLEVANVPAFWEDHLFTEAGKSVAFRVGSVSFLGSNPCARCVVPTRHPTTTERITDFQKEFIRQRQATLPTEVDRSRFDHFYRLTLNTQVPASEAGKIIEIGDAIEVD